MSLDCYRLNAFLIGGLKMDRFLENYKFLGFFLVNQILCNPQQFKLLIPHNQINKFSTILVNFQKLQKIFLLKFKILSYSLLISFYQNFSNKCHAITSKVLQLPNINNRFVFRFCLNEAKLNFGKKTTRYDFTRFSCNKTQVMFFLQKLWKPELKMILFFLLKTLILLPTKKVNKKIVKKTGHNMG